MRTLVILGLLIVFGSISVAAAAEIYRWTDENGVTQYTDSPPEQARYERINVRTGASRKSDENVAAEPEETPEAQALAERAQRCESARANLELLASGNEVTLLKDGKPHTLGPEEIEEQRDHNQGIVARNCD